MTNDNKSNLKANHGANNAHFKHVIIIPYVPLQPNLNSFLERYSYPLMNVFLKRIDRLKPIVICSSWRVQK